MFQRRPALPSHAPRPHRHAPLAIAAFAVVGAASLAFGLAASQDTPAVPNALTVPPAGDYRLVSGDPAGNRLRYAVRQPAAVQVTYQSDWTLFQSTDESVLSLALLAPGTTFVHVDEGQPSVQTGALVELTAAPNRQFTSPEAVLKQLGANAMRTKNLTVAGRAAVEYRLSEELEEESRPKIITTFFDGATQYAVSLATAGDPRASPAYEPYQQLLQSLTLQP